MGNCIFTQDFVASENHLSMVRVM